MENGNYNVTERNDGEGKYNVTERNDGEWKI